MPCRFTRVPAVNPLVGLALLLRMEIQRPAKKFSEYFALNLCLARELSLSLKLCFRSRPGGRWPLPNRTGRNCLKTEDRAQTAWCVRLSSAVVYATQPTQGVRPRPSIAFAFLRSVANKTFCTCLSSYSCKVLVVRSSSHKSSFECLRMQANRSGTREEEKRTRFQLGSSANEPAGSFCRPAVEKLISEMSFSLRLTTTDPPWGSMSPLCSPARRFLHPKRGSVLQRSANPPSKAGDWLPCL